MSDALTGKTLGKFEILDVIGRGGMATVYRAHQTTMKRDVAIKVMKREISEDEEFITRFEREAEIFAVLQHPHILPVIDFGRSEDGWVYIVFRLIEGGGLDTQIRTKGSIKVDVASKMLTQISSALTFAHEKSIIHRDLKSNNILLDNRNNAYLTDFGIAKMLASTTRLTSTDHIMGTPSYMAPEQWRGETIDARTDIYALGVIAYEMLSGMLPYTADTPFTLMYKHMNEIPPSLSDMPKKIPQAVEAVIIRAMAKLPEDRFQSADEFATAFHKAVTNEEFPAAVKVIHQPNETPLVQIKFDEMSLPEVDKTLSVDSQQLLVEYQDTKSNASKAADTVDNAKNRTDLMAKNKSRNLALPVGIVVVLVIILAGIFILTQDDDNKSASVSPTETVTVTASPTSTDIPEPTVTIEPSATSTEAFDPFIIIVAEIAEMRSGPGNNFEIIEELQRDDEYDVSGITEDGRWFQISANQRLGWVSATSVQLNGERGTVPILALPDPTNTLPPPTQSSNPSVPADLLEYVFDEMEITIIVPKEWEVTEHPNLIDVLPSTERITLEQPVRIRRFGPESIRNSEFELSPQIPLEDNARNILTSLLDGEPQNEEVQGGGQFDPNFPVVAINGTNDRLFGRVILIQAGDNLIAISYIVPRLAAENTQLDEMILFPIIYGLRIDGATFSNLRGPATGSPGEGQPNQGQQNPPGQGPPGSPPPTRPN